MGNPEARNREKLNLLLDEACRLLRELFTKTWKERFGRDWDKDSSYRILGHNLQNIQPIHTKLIEEGDIDMWDLTTLRAVLTAEDLFNLPSDQTARIIEIDNIRSEIVHHPTPGIAEKQFSDWFSDLHVILMVFGMSCEKLQQIRQSEADDTQKSSSASVNLNKDSGDIPGLDFSKKLDDPNRTARIMLHRGWINQYRMMSNTSKYRSALSIQVPLTQELPQCFMGFKSITLQDMEPFEDVIYEGRKFAVTVIDEVGFTGSCIALVVEDQNGDVERCSIYGSPYMNDETEARYVFRPGCKMIIIRPYMRMAMDGKPVIRVDDPATIVMRGYIPNMCRYCGKPNADKSCGRCKNALYCDKMCQTLDWKKLKHKLICQ